MGDETREFILRRQPCYFGLIVSRLVPLSIIAGRLERVTENQAAPLASEDFDDQFFTAEQT